MTAKTTGKLDEEHDATEETSAEAAEVETSAEAAEAEAPGETAEVEAPGETAEEAGGTERKAVPRKAVPRKAVPKKAGPKKAGPKKADRKTADAETARGDSPKRRVRVAASPRLVAAVAALVFVTAVTTAVIQWREAGRLAGRDRTEQQVRDRSAEFARALLAYRHADLPGARANIRALASADFGRQYETAFNGLAEVITKYKADATATVRETYLNAFDGQRAKTLVILDSEVKSTMGVRRVLGTKLLLELVQEKGAWRVNGMTSLPADDETLTKPDGTVEKPQQGTTPQRPNP
ncbi:hypothetical protein [Spirillospora sp. NPDC047279]|uniref:hypothetical protein n=1 Tax=Spirillospora sp. NPDC047279 TaxID=3155478 RepID=UPI0033F437E4